MMQQVKYWKSNLEVAGLIPGSSGVTQQSQACYLHTTALFTEQYELVSGKGDVALKLGR